jgi:hypothetical protein
MAVDVDEPRRQHQAIGINHSRHRSRDCRGDLGNPPVNKRYIGPEGFPARSIYYRCAPDDTGVHRNLSWWNHRVSVPLIIARNDLICNLLDVCLLVTTCMEIINRTGITPGIFPFAE